MEAMEVDLFGEPINPPDKPALDKDLLQALLDGTHHKGPRHGGKDPGIWMAGRGSFKKRIMVVGYYPIAVEEQIGRVFSSSHANRLEQALKNRVGENMDDYYLTNLVKYPLPLGTNPPKEAANLCYPYLLEEIKKLEPSLIICLGGEVFTHLTGYEGNLEDYRGTRLTHPDFKSQVSVVWAPASVAKSPENEDIWVVDLRALLDKLNIDAETNWEEQDRLPVKFIKNLDELRAAVDEELAKETMDFAIDTEFDGETWYEAHFFKLDISTKDLTLDLQLMEPEQGYDPIMVPATKGRHRNSTAIEFAERQLFDSKEELDGYLKSHPLRTKPIAAFIREYRWAFGGTEAEVAKELNRLFRRDGVRVWGHNGRVDYKLLLRMGVNIWDKVDFDTITMALHIHESQPLGLEDISKRYLGAPNHKLGLIHWLNTNKVVGGKLPYSFVPRSIIDPYAVADTRRTYDLRAELMKILEVLEEQTRKRGEPSIKEAYFKYKMGQFKALGEMEVVGQHINLQALKALIDWYDTKKREQKRKCISNICDATGWKSFTPSSPQQVERLLFDTLGLMPLYSTDKPPVPWARVLEMPPHEQKKFTPSTNQETLETLALENNICADLNNTRILYTIAKSYLRKGARWGEAKKEKVDLLELWHPEVANNKPEQDEDDEDHWEAGAKDKRSRALSQIVHPNGYLYSSYFELLETHRLATKPNISAIPKGEGKYISDITGEVPPCEIRWLFDAPQDWVVAEADWVTGEVWLIMTLAQDPEGLKQVSDPEKYDIHSAMAKRMFPQTIPSDMPEIEVKKKFKKERDAAKPVTFGVPYQRGAEAIARQLNREAANNKLDVVYTKDDGEVFIRAYRENFPKAWAYLERQMGMVRNPKYQTSPWGFRRRYPDINDQKIINKLQREASNWQIQHGVACCMMTACSVWSRLKAGNPEMPMFMVDILHDATKWLIHKSVLDLAPKIISTVMGDGLTFPRELKISVPLRHEVIFYEQWGGKKVPDNILATIAGETSGVSPSEIELAVPTYKHLKHMYT